jgi:hypothetical protein
VDLQYSCETNCGGGFVAGRLVFRGNFGKRTFGKEGRS